MFIKKKVLDRFVHSIPKFQKILSDAKDRDINESDTVNIINDMLHEIFGYNKYQELTSEYMIRGTYCDIAVGLSSQIQYLIEIKAVGMPLKDRHIKQVVDYATNSGTNWVILTNGIVWKIYKVEFNQPISLNQIANINILEIKSNIKKDHESLYLVTKEGVLGGVREECYEKAQIINKHTIGGFLVSPPVLSNLRRELRKYAKGLKVNISDLEDIIKNEILKREILESDDGKSFFSKTQRYFRKKSRNEKKKINNEQLDESALVKKGA